MVWLLSARDRRAYGGGTARPTTVKRGGTAEEVIWHRTVAVRLCCAPGDAACLARLASSLQLRFWFSTVFRRNGCGKVPNPNLWITKPGQSALNIATTEPTKFGDPQVGASHFTLARCEVGCVILGWPGYRPFSTDVSRGSV